MHWGHVIFHQLSSSEQDPGLITFLMAGENERMAEQERRMAPAAILIPFCPEPCPAEARLEMTCTYYQSFSSDMWLILFQEQESLPPAGGKGRELCILCSRDYLLSSADAKI